MNDWPEFKLDGLFVLLGILYIQLIRMGKLINLSAPGMKEYRQKLRAIPTWIVIIATVTAILRFLTIF